MALAKGHLQSKVKRWKPEQIGFSPKSNDCCRMEEKDLMSFLCEVLAKIFNSRRYPTDLLILRNHEQNSHYQFNVDTTYWQGIKGATVNWQSNRASGAMSNFLQDVF